MDILLLNVLLLSYLSDFVYVCVVGTAEGGHYYSYIKESREDVLCRLGASTASHISREEVEASRRWIEFNDTEVQPLEVALIHLFVSLEALLLFA